MTISRNNKINGTASKSMLGYQLNFWLHGDFISDLFIKIILSLRAVRRGLLTDLSNPRLDWATIAQGFGLPASRVDSAEELSAALERSFAEPGPSLIEAAL